MGFNGDALDLKIPAVVDTSIPEDEEKQIQHLLAVGSEHRLGMELHTLDRKL